MKNGSPAYLRFTTRIIAFAVFQVGLLPGNGLAQSPQQRAKPPTFNRGEVSRVFFSDVAEALRGERPTLANLRNSGNQMLAAANESEASGEKSGTKVWDALISTSSIEDEIKRIKLRYDSTITTPGAFNGGGYQDARLNLSVLASLFAVISQYSADIRWKEQATQTRDLLAKTARNCAAGSTQVYNEAKLRKADLQDIVSGGGLNVKIDAEDENDWSMVADRSPLMSYAEELLDELSDKAVDAKTVENEVESVLRLSELLAMLGEILVKEGMDDSDDDDYSLLSRNMTKASSSVVAAINRKDFESVRKAVGAITQSCADCHEQYR